MLLIIISKRPFTTCIQFFESKKENIINMSMSINHAFFYMFFKRVIESLLCLPDFE